MHDDPCFDLGGFFLGKCNYISDTDLFKQGNSWSTFHPKKLPSTEMSKITVSFSDQEHNNVEVILYTDHCLLPSEETDDVIIRKSYLTAKGVYASSFRKL